MKREILFRGKTQYGNWVHGNLDVDGFDNVLIKTYTRHGNSQHYDYCEVIPETVGQFTGLTDKNGKRIFEGDIVNHGNLCAHFKIKWNSESAMFKHCHKIYTERIEVIGNIHDNPELI